MKLDLARLNLPDCLQKFPKFSQSSAKFSKYLTKLIMFGFFLPNNVSLEKCKGVFCVDLGESFQMSIYLQKSASIQPRTSPSKFGGKLLNIIHSCP